MKIRKNDDIRFQLAVVILLPLLIIVQLAVKDIHAAGLTMHSSWETSLTFHFVHGNFFHLLLNWWCLLSISFIYRFRWFDALAAWLIASCYMFAGTQPIVGMSGIVYVLIATMVMDRKYDGKFQVWSLVLVMILATGLIQNIGLGIHLWSFGLGTIYGVLKYVGRSSLKKL